MIKMSKLPSTRLADVVLTVLAIGCGMISITCCTAAVNSSTPVGYEAADISEAAAAAGMQTQEQDLLNWAIGKHTASVNFWSFEQWSGWRVIRIAIFLRLKDGMGVVACRTLGSEEAAGDSGDTEGPRSPCCPSEGDEGPARGPAAGWLHKSPALTANVRGAAGLLDDAPGDHDPNLPLHAAILQEPLEADLMRAALLHLTATDATDTDKVDALLRLRDLVRPIDNANGGRSPLCNRDLAARHPCRAIRLRGL